MDPAGRTAAAADWVSGPLPWGPDAEWGAATAWPCPLPDPIQGSYLHALTLCLCSMQEKSWKYTRDQTPLALRDPNPEEAAELPDIVVSRS